jgi:hypothetical protein
VSGGGEAVRQSAEKAAHENLAARLYLADRERPGDRVPFIAQTPDVRARYRVMATVAEDEFRRRLRRFSPGQDAER